MSSQICAIILEHVLKEESSQIMTDIDPEMPEEVEVVPEESTPYPARNAWFVLLLIVIAVLGFLALSGVFGDDNTDIDPVPTTVETTVVDTVPGPTDTVVVDTTLVEVSTTLEDPASS